MQLLGRGVNGYTTLLLEINTIFQFDLYIVMGRGIFSAKVFKLVNFSLKCIYKPIFQVFPPK